MAVSAPGRREHARRGHVIDPHLFRLWMARRGLHFHALRTRYGFPPTTLAALMNGKPVDATTLHKLDAVARAEPLLSIADELFPLNGVAREEAEAELETACRPVEPA